MFLKRIELQGFKSFADRSVIHFDSDVIGIVGPNGCGKSNINDAIRWVLGEQSVKSLRGTSMSDVIFNGSSDRKKVNTAEVTLVFDNSKHILHVDYEEVEVTRRLHRQSGEGEYFINKTPCRLKDILNLVMDTGLGKDSLSIISQGNISAFADAKPEDRRALFEEAAGVAKYKKRKNESLNKLNRCQDNLDRLDDIIEELNRQINPLKRQANKAEIYIEKKKALEEIEVSVLVDDIENLQQQSSEISQKLFDVNSQKAMNETMINVEDLKNHEMRNEMYRVDREITKLQEQYTKTNEEVRIVEARKIELDEKRKYALQYGDRKQKAKELKAMVDEAHMEYIDRFNRMKELEVKMGVNQQAIFQNQEVMANALQECNKEESILQRLQNRKDVLENLKKSPMQHQHAQQAVLHANLQGIHGVVSSLMNVQDEYAQAISNALGGAMYYLVCEDEKSGRYAIEFLKRNQSGRATFLPLSVMKPRFIMKDQLMVLQHMDGYVGIANEFVKCDARFVGIRDSLLGNVIVVDTLVHANEIASILKYRYKIVTLDGDIVNIGGSMSGGRGKNQTTPLSIQSELNHIISNLEGQKMKVDHSREEVSSLQSKQNELQNEKVDLQISFAKLDPILKVKENKYKTLKAEFEEYDEEEIIEENKQDDLIQNLNALYSKLDELTSSMKSKRERRLSLGRDVERKDQQIRSLRKELNDMQNETRDLEVHKAKVETRLENALERLTTTYEMTYEYASGQKMDIEIESARQQVKELRSEIQSLGNVNLDAPREYEEVNTRYTFLTSQKEELLQARSSILQAIDEMDEIMVKQFSEMFNKINGELQAVFASLFGGGKARLFMVNPDDILNTGIDIDVQPPGKNVQNLRLFSGGEKSLIAICVLFAILKARTVPLCIFDEVEAALDQANVERFAKYISQFRGESQFIVVTHRPGTMAQCDALYGVTMQQNGVSQLLKVRLQDAINMTNSNEEVSG